MCAEARKLFPNHEAPPHSSPHTNRGARDVFYPGLPQGRTSIVKIHIVVKKWDCCVIHMYLFIENKKYNSER